MKKRILSIVLATALILAMAIPASAATVSDSGSYTGSTGTCSYHWQANCTLRSWSAFIEWTYSTDSYSNYYMLVDIYTYKANSGIKQITLGEYSTMMSTNSATTNYDISHISAYFRINGDTIASAVTVRPS